jgi:SAM-dependent methyltransferase
MNRFLRLTSAFAVAAVACVQAHATNHNLGDEKYQPHVGQEGKDVIWVPTSDALVKKMLDVAKVTADDLVFDLGAGDGKIPIAAARDYGATAVGIEYNAEMAALARRNAARAGVADKVKIITGDIFKEDFSKATVVTLYLLPDLNLKLRPTLLKMKPGTRIVSHAFTMGDWEPDQKIQTEIAHGFYWVVPANVAGKWSLTGMGTYTDVSLQLDQRYQKVGGTITVNKKTLPILSPSLRADRLSFSFLDERNELRSVKVRVTGNQLDGDAEAGNTYYSLKGTRQ